MISVIDYGMGNLRSVAKALEAAGAGKVFVTADIKAIDKADKIVLPGVGAMQDAMKELKRLDLIKVIKESILKKPFLGICLGLQLLFTESQEGGKTQGLGVFAGKVKRFSPDVKAPHMGWNQVKRMTEDVRHKALADARRSSVAGEGRRTHKCRILENIPDNSFFYFCHSYYVVPEDRSLIATTTDYGREFVSSIAKDTLFACQFHPEKSQRLGLRLLENFVRL